MVDIAPCSDHCAVVEEDCSIPENAGHVFGQDLLAFRTLGPGSRRLRIIGKELDHPSETPPLLLNLTLPAVVKLLEAPAC
jgi:hypothetical protein